MALVFAGRKFSLACGVVLAACSIRTDTLVAQYRMQPGCACAGDCTAPGGVVTSPVQPGQPQPPVESQQQPPAAKPPESGRRAVCIVGR